MNKPFEFWAVVVGMIVYVATRNADDATLPTRIAKAVIAGALGVGLAGEVAPYLRDSEAIAAVVIMAFGQIILDVGTAIISDREFVKRIIAKKTGLDDE